MSDGDHWAEALAELDRLDGTLVPEFVQVQDGWYDRRVVLDRQVVAGFLDPDSAPEEVPWHYAQARIPRYRTELRWVPSNARGRSDG